MDQDDKLKNYEKALQNASDLIKKEKEYNDKLKVSRDLWNDISVILFGVSSSEFFKKIPKTTQDIINSNNEIQKLEKQITQIGKTFNESFTFDKNGDLATDLNKYIGNMKQFSLQQQEDFKKISEHIEKNGTDISSFSDEERENYQLINLEKDKMLGNQKEIDKLLSKQFDDYESITRNHSEYMRGKLGQAIVEKDISGFLTEHGEKALSMLLSMKSISDEEKEQLVQHHKINEELKKSVAFQKDFEKTSFEIGKYLEKIGENWRKTIKDVALGFDQLLSNFQKNSGIALKENASQMTELTSLSNAYGVSTEQVLTTMADLGEELRTTDFKFLKQATTDFLAIEAATGLTSKEITHIAGGLMRAGVASSDITKSIQETNVESKLLGVNTKSVLMQMDKNISKMKTFGFTGGIESLRKMAVEAERLRINVEDIFDVASKARNIEGAMEMAADLQLAGGSFAAINPMDLLKAARTSPEELQKLLSKMGTDIGDFNDKNVFEFDVTDTERLQIVAEATNMKLESLQAMIEKNAMTNKKLEFFPSSLFDINVDEKDRNMLAEMTEFDKNGSLVIKTEFEDIAKKAGIKDISLITPEQLRELKDLRVKNIQDLKEQAAANASLVDALQRLGNSLLQVFTIFEPAISYLAEKIASVAQWVGETDGIWGTILKTGAGIVAAFALASTGFVQALIKYFVPGAKSMANLIRNTKIGSVFGLSKGESNVVNQTSQVQGGGGLAGFAESVKTSSDHASGIKWDGLLKLVAAFALLGAAVTTAMFFAVQQMSMDDLQKMAMLGLVLIEIAGSFYLTSKASEKIDLKGIGVLSAAFIGIGIGMVPFAYAAKMLSGDGGIDWFNVIAGLGLMLGAVVALGVLGIYAVNAYPVILAGAAAIIAVGVTMLLAAYSLSQLSNAFKGISEVNWEGFSGMGTALMSVVPGLTAFSIATLLFANPIGLAGMVIMTASLGALSMVMIPLSHSLSAGATAIHSMAEGVGKLKEAMVDLKLDKLEKLSEVSQNLVGAATKSNSETTSSSSNGAKSNDSGKRTVVHHVNLKINGRQLQQLIIDDTDLQS